MAGLTLAQAEAQLAAYLAAETKVLAGQEYEIAGRRLRRANLAEIRDGIRIWNERVGELSSRALGRGRGRTIVSAD